MRGEGNTEAVRICLTLDLAKAGLTVFADDLVFSMQFHPESHKIHS